MSARANLLESSVRQPAYRGENLIFIISQPRSGSTLLQRVLAGHPDIQTSAETWLMLHPVYGLRTNGIQTEFGSRWRERAVSDFLEHYTDGVEVYDEATRAWAQVIYGNALKRSGRALFLDKTPRYFFIIPELHRLFPLAKFVFLLRNPLAVLASELNTYVKGDWPVLGKFAADLLDAPGLILDGVRLLGDDAISVHYEEFVANPAETTSALCGRLNIAFHESMLDYSSTPIPQGRMNDPIGVHQHTRPSQSSLEKWRHLADDPQSCLFARGYLEDLGRDTFSRLGYSFDDVDDALGRATAAKDDVGLFPWRLAIAPRERWTERQRFQAERYFASQSKGRLRGTLSTLRRTGSRWIRTARQQLSADGMERQRRR